jgi:hypothetical protein
MTDPWATPESSIAGSPEPEANPLLLQRTVEMMADIDRIDKHTSDKINKLRTVAAKLRLKASDLQSLLQAERAMRVRMEDYLTHWTQTNPRWTYEAVWCGQIRVRNMYEALEVSTSDEEDLVEAQDNVQDGNGYAYVLPLLTFPVILMYFLLVSIWLTKCQPSCSHRQHAKRSSKMKVCPREANCASIRAGVGDF